MIFLVLIAIIVLIVLALNLRDSSNIEQINEYLLNKKCENIYYSKGIFKGICENEIVQINNSFTVDLEKNKKIIKINKIRELTKDKLNIIINKNHIIKFSTEENMNSFYKKLEEKIN